MTRIPVNPELLTWARERACLPDRQAGLDRLALAGLCASVRLGGNP
jgi:hypothetical protein